MRSVDDVLALLSRPKTGVSETAAAPGWRILQHHFPEMRSVVVRRPIPDAVDSVMRMNTGGVATYDPEKVRRLFEREVRDLDRIAAQPGVLAFDFADLKREDACAAIFEHCLPYRFDRKWWEFMRNRNIQANIPARLIHCFTHRETIDGFKRQCGAELRRIARCKVAA